VNSPIRHTMLVANAGSGKTYALTTRMVKLLALGVNPRRIAALTFTKKAAGEFLDAVFLRLAFAATDSGELDRLNRDLNQEKEEGSVAPLDAVRCRELLELLVDQSGSLTMGTIDSLFARIARSFPLESGLPGEFTMIGESELERARTEALAEVFRSRSEGREFLDLVRRIARRNGERQVFRTLLQSVKDFHEKFLKDTRLPWGEKDLIWKGTRCAILEAGEVKPAADAFWAEIDKTHPDLGEAAAARLTLLLGMASELRPGSVWPETLKIFINKKLCMDLESDAEKGPYFGLVNGSPKNRIYMRGNVGALREELRNALLKPVYESLLQRSKALRSFMATFEQSYHRLTRGRGMMTFSDVTDLLASQSETSGWTTSVGYRIDSTLDHWLLDEFQDTSRLQWKVLGSFVDEVIQDAGGERSLFYVGDTKQAIYSWRGGDPRLFFEVFDRNNKGSEDRLFKRDLSVSYRSAQPIIDFVNAVFGNIDGCAGALGLPGKTVEDWNKAWRDHKEAKREVPLKGYVRWEAVTSEQDDENTVHRRVVAILKEVMPWKRGFSCAVLTRKNEETASIASLLQSEGLPVSLEGKSNPCNDNPLGLALLSAFRTAAFPEDRISKALLESSPLRALLSEGEQAFRAKAFETIASSGYEETVRSWTEGIDLDPFLSRRAADFLSAAGEFDASGRGPVEEFTAFLEGHVVQEAEASGVVRVMTVHQSKGLTFDMSIVAGLDGKGVNGTDVLHLGGGNPPTWGCLLPSNDAAYQDPVMEAALTEIRSEEEYGKLCTAYVAMTRSRHGLYILTKRLNDRSDSKNFARLLMLALHPGSDTVERGEAQWFSNSTPSGELREEATHGKAVLPPCHAGTPHALSPSSLAKKIAAEEQTGSKAPFSPDAADLGTEIHEVLSRIEWDPSQADLAKCSAPARELLERFLRSEQAREVFTKPPGEWDLWNEKPFDIAMEGTWVSGCFDRVHIRRESGRPLEALILDYKTNRSTPEAIAKEYTGQMEQYRKAASVLLRLPMERIKAATVPVRIIRP
jgi:ATP-dependent helicase/nuclease subunit A